MKIFALIVACLSVLFYIVIPGIEEYNKHKAEPKIKRFLYALIPLLYFIGMAIGGFILFEIIPRILGPILENIF
jgi:hypothetical protein